jgi:hypothetical protein
MLRHEIPRALGMTRVIDAAGAYPVIARPEAGIMSKLAKMANLANLAKMQVIY